MRVIYLLFSNVIIYIYLVAIFICHYNNTFPMCMYVGGGVRLKKEISSKPICNNTYFLNRYNTRKVGLV